MAEAGTATIDNGEVRKTFFADSRYIEAMIDYLAEHGRVIKQEKRSGSGYIETYDLADQG